MIASAARALASVLLLATAPLQCGHTSDASLREDETPGDALWALAAQFRDAHDESAEKKTLQYLVSRYPLSRWVPAAREELARLGGGAGDGGAQ
jgi:hypothetical protein